jgi:hypothetical protein
MDLLDAFLALSLEELQAYQARRQEENLQLDFKLLNESNMGAG